MNRTIPTKLTVVLLSTLLSGVLTLYAWSNPAASIPVISKAVCDIRGGDWDSRFGSTKCYEHSLDEILPDQPG
jgi:hypothetical protein